MQIRCRFEPKRQPPNALHFQVLPESQTRDQLAFAPRGLEHSHYLSPLNFNSFFRQAIVKSTCFKVSCFSKKKIIIKVCNYIKQDILISVCIHKCNIFLFHLNFICFRCIFRMLSQEIFFPVKCQRSGDRWHCSRTVHV